MVRSLLPCALLLLLACGGSVQPPDAGTPDAGEPDAGALDAGTPDGGSGLAMQIAAATQTASSGAACSGLDSGFYWEVGDVNAPIASGSVGTAYAADTVMPIASASKWIFGAYVVERFKDNLANVDFQAMTMRSGYVSFNDGTCGPNMSIDACSAVGSNGMLTPSQVGRFHYDGAHFLHYSAESVDAGGLGLGAMKPPAFTDELKSYLGTELDFAYATPDPAGSIRTSAAVYGQFLRKVLAGQLAISQHLGDGKVCTLAGPDCPDAVAGGSPAAPYAWHYSYGHWVEDDPSAGDGAFSSPGAHGFYPWIDASRSYYGVLARDVTSMGLISKESVLCGQAIRRAFMTGTAQ
jgi:hypothetical protein